jgi:hypothetical protein
MQIIKWTLLACLASAMIGCSGGGSGGDPTKDDAANAGFDNSKSVPAEKWTPAPGSAFNSEAPAGGSDASSAK